MTVPAPRLPLVDIPQPRSRGFGRLEALGPQPIALPLSGVQVRARVADRVAEVEIEQTFTNVLREPLEAIYVFPLGGGSAVSRFELQVGARVIQGAIRERAQARREYDEALLEGRRAGLLEQERDDVFTVQVGNLSPGEKIVVRLRTSERLPFFEDGTTELRLPLVVAPRYVGGEPLGRDPVGRGVEEDTTTVPDASRITPPRLAPGFDPRTALGIEVELFGGAAELACSQHAVRSASGPEAMRVRLSREDELLDRDFVLRWKVAAEKVRASLLVNGSGPERFSLLSVIPPAREGFLGVPRDVVFVVDRSGSMQGPKMASAARSCALLLRTLAPRDRFALQSFAEDVEWMPGGFMAASEAALETGERWLRGIAADGGTELDGALGAALAEIGKLGPDAGRIRVVVLLTDGQVGDESSSLRRLQRELGEARVFTVGIDTAVNSGFLRRLAALGGGTSTFVEPGSALEEALAAVGREIGAPLVTDLRIEGDEIEQRSVAPARVPDLFAGRASAVLFRGGGRVKVKGRWADGAKFEEVVEPREAPLAAIDHLWARARIADLEDAFRAAPSDDVRREIVALSLKHTVLTRFTAFVVVDGKEIVNPGGQRRTLVQPVHSPSQWEMMKHLGAVRPGGVAAVTLGRGPTLAARIGAGAQKAFQAIGSLGAPAGLHRFSGGGTRPGSQERPSASEIEAVRKAFDELKRAFEAARAELSGGRLPAVDALETARAALLAALGAALSLATGLPLLQRFLRGALVELIAAIRDPGATARLASAVADRHAPALEAAAAEAVRIAAGADPGSFWEASI